MVHLPNGATMASSHTPELDIPELNAAASKAHVFPGMASHYLFSVGQLCDEGYTVTFQNPSVTVCNSQKYKLLNGAQDSDTGIWCIDLKRDNTHIPESIANNVYELRSTGALVNYVHKALFSPTKSAMLQAVKDGHLIKWPGLTGATIHKQLNLTPATPAHNAHLEKRRLWRHRRLTEIFMVQFRKGNSCVVCCYVYDCNCNKVIPTESRSDS
jgi:hypothetical protein